MEFTEKNIFNAITRVVKWYELGLQLDFETYQLDIIKTNHLNDVNGAKINLISEWLNNDKNASWEKLTSALRKMGHRNLADALFQDDIKGTVSYIKYSVTSLIPGSLLLDKVVPRKSEIGMFSGVQGTIGVVTMN